MEKSIDRILFDIEWNIEVLKGLVGMPGLTDDQLIEKYPQVFKKD